MRIMLAVLLGFAVLSIAHAEEGRRGACRADVQRFCKDVSPGGGAIARCLAQHESELSTACRERVAKGREQTEQFAEACKPDADRLCKQVQAGGGRLMRCLAQNKEQLSPACKEKIAEAERRHPCMADMERYCKSVQPGGGRVEQCLKEHRAQLAPACKAALAPAEQKK